jgi:predicted CopG family antitoxin
MTSKTITIRQEVYDRLSRVKKVDENFSDVITRLLDNQKKDPLRHFGIGKDMQDEFLDAFEKGIALSREESRHSQEKRFKNLWGNSVG